MAAKASTKSSGFRCSECGWTTVKWVGRCGECQAWGSVSELGAVTVRTTSAAPVERPAVPIGQVDVRRAEARSTGVSEFDRVLGGGLVPGAVVLVAGEPGIGKSTLLLDVAARAARQGDGRTVLYITGEESAAQVRMRAERIEAMAASLFLASETDLATVLGQIEAVQPDLLVIDSVQTIASGEVEGAAGNVSQVREVAASLIQVAKSRGIATLLVGHVTKDGSIAGPRVLEHLVDVVVQFEGDRHSRLRLVRAVKNRYGPTDEVGCFDLSDVGIVGLADPSGLFLSRGTLSVPGTCVTVTLEGRRPLMTEVQALVAKSEIPTPRRATSGLDSARGRDDHRRPRTPSGGAHRHPGRLPVHRRRGASHRARLRPGRGAGDGQCPDRPSAGRALRRLRRARAGRRAAPRHRHTASARARPRDWGSARPMSPRGSSAPGPRPRA